MSRILKFVRRRTVDEEASLWYARIDAGLTPDSREELRKWLATDPRHRPALARMGTLWGEMAVLQELSEIFPLQPRSATLGRISRFAAIAATFAVLGVIVGIWVLSRDGARQALDATVSTATTSPQGTPVGTAAPHAYSVATKVGERRTERLSDGSVVQLNTSTRMRVDLGADIRRITLLNGEAQFDVSPDPSRPFVVIAGPRSVRAVGTAFNVLLDRDRLEVTVTEGKVAIADVDRAQGVRPDLKVSSGEVATVRPERIQLARVDAAAADARLAWQRGMLVFRGETLGSALADVERYTDVRFHFQDPAVRSLRIAGTFKIGDIDGLLETLRDNLQVRVSRDANRVLIEPAE